jgi:branched-chain amino acid transport system substrate-binding protein
MKFRTTLKLLAASIAAAGMTAAVQAADVKFGFAAPLTGPQSHYGEDMQNGLNLALEEANKKGIKIDG